MNHQYKTRDMDEITLLRTDSMSALSENHLMGQQLSEKHTELHDGRFVDGSVCVVAV